MKLARRIKLIRSNTVLSVIQLIFLNYMLLLFEKWIKTNVK